MNVNTVLTIASLAIFGVVIALLYLKSKNQTVKVEVESFNTIDKVLEAVKNEMVEIVKEDFTLGLSDDEFDRLYRRKARINDALKNCVYGIDAAKVLVIDLIRGFIADKVPKEQVSVLLGLTDETEPSIHVKFEILMYRYKKAYGKDALVKWIDKYDFARERVATGADRAQDKAYYITEEDLEMSYANEDIELSIEEQIDVLAVLVYQMYKGFGIVDTLREMNINGFNMGTSGSILTTTNTNRGKDGFRGNKSVWLYDRGKYIHLRFLNLNNEEELRRIIQLMVRYGSPGPLTAKRGYLVNTMYDKSRILALRPPASEYWAIFVRKFTLSDVSPEALIVKEYTKRGDLAIRLIEFLMRGQVTCGVTGRQGSGKTTLMSSIIRYIDPRYTIRILELAPELYLRELYPTRNILSVQETSTVSASALQDALKKSDAAVSIVGEVASDIIAARMIQLGQVASLFTLFSHHANTSKDLVLALRNSLVNAGGFSNMQTAEKQVTDVVKCDIHLDYTADGKRYIERISEIVPLAEGIPYPEIDESNLELSNTRLNREFYERSTDRVGFYTHDILKYDLDTHTYYVADRFSPTLEKAIRNSLGIELRAVFDEFMLKEWGPRDSNTSEQDVRKELDTLHTKIAAFDKQNEKMLQESQSTAGAESGVSNPSSPYVMENEQALDSMWKSGYTPSNEAETKEAQEFELGDFFDDDLYN